MDIDNLNGIQLLLRHHGNVRRRMRTLKNLEHHLLSNELDLRDEAVADAREIVRFLEVYHPLHERDETLSLFPRLEKALKEAGQEESQAAKEIANAHEEHQAYDEIWVDVQDCLWLVCTPDAIVSRDRLCGAIEKIDEHFSTHFEREELYVFPAAIKLFSEEDLTAMRDEIVARHKGRFADN